jgi:hypothetical protein
MLAKPLPAIQRKERQREKKEEAFSIANKDVGTDVSTTTKNATFFTILIPLFHDVQGPSNPESVKGPKV